MVANFFIGKAFDQQIQKDAQAFRTRLLHTIDQLIQDIHEKVRREIKDWRVVQAIQRREPHPPGIADSVLDVLEYGTQDGLITASKGDSDLRHGEKDPEALDRAGKLKPAAGLSLRTPDARTTIEVTLPIQAEGKFLGFVTGGYFLHSHLSQALKDLTLHPIFLKEGARLVSLNDPGDTIPPFEQESLLAFTRGTDGRFRKIRLIGVPHSVSRVSILTSDIEPPALASRAVGAELILAYSHRDEIALRRQLMFILFITGGVGLISVYIVSYVVGLQMTKPINQLAVGAAEIASGNLEHQVAIQSRDEIGGLAGAFNQMAATLKANLERQLAAERLAAWRDVARRVAHEIKNPLFPIRLSVENLQRSYRSKPAVFAEIFEECTDTVIEEVGRLQRMVDEFHQFARMPVPQRKPSALNQIVRNVLTLYAESVAHIQIEADLDTNLLPVSVDSEQISQALGNLIKNAIEAMPNAGTLSVLTQLVDAVQIRIEIQDTGMGMSSETLAQIFAPYYTTKEAGTGLGMAIVQRIITDHDGEISVESEEGVGTTVRIELPVHDGEHTNGG